MKTTEKIFIIISLLGLLMKFLGYPGAGIILLLSLFFFSMLYAFGLFFILVVKQPVILEEEETHEESNLKLEQSGKKRIYTTPQLVISIFSGFAFSVMLLGLLYKIQKYPGASIMLISGVLFTLVSLILGIFLLSKHAVFSKKLITRGAILLVLGVSLYFVSQRRLVEIEYRNNPELREIHLEILDNPYCMDCKMRLNEYRRSN